MNELEAYPSGLTDSQRSTAVYKHGDRVHLGPGYRGNGLWVNEPGQGDYYVVRPLISDGHNDYYLCRYSPDGQWDYICHASRLTLYGEVKS